MPTFARLAGAVLLAALGAYAAMLARAHLPDGEPGGMLIPVSAAAGAVIGWTFTGRHLDRGRGNGVAIGFGSAVLLVFWVGFLFSGQEMIYRATTRNQYGGSPTDAVQDVFNIFIDYARDVLQFDVVLVLGLGGVAVGAITSFVGKRYR